jgi:fibronectin type 3 domain-containing protein
VAALLLATSCAPSQDPTIDLSCRPATGAVLNVGDSVACTLKLTFPDQASADTTREVPPLYEWAVLSADGGAMDPGPAKTIEWGLGARASQTFKAVAKGNVIIKMRQLSTTTLLFRELYAGSSEAKFQIGQSTPAGCTTNAECTAPCTTQCEGAPESATCIETAGTCSCQCAEPSGCTSNADCTAPCTAECEGPPETATCIETAQTCSCQCPESDCDQSGFNAASESFSTSGFGAEHTYRAFSATSPVQRLTLEFKIGTMGPGEYVIANTAVDKDPATCTICARLELACGESTCTTSYFGTGGTITVTAINEISGIFVGTLTDATFQQLATGTQTLISGGPTWCIDDYDFDVSPECILNCGGGGAHELCNVFDGCGGLCECLATDECNLESGLCEPRCVPNCAPDTCNVGDGCGGLCGCSATQTCDLETHLCTPPCVKTCAAGACGMSDNCGGICGCSPSQTCNETTQTCTPPCKKKCETGQCGMDDGCGGSCTCETGESCDFEKQLCVPACTPSCEPGACGIGDDCGGKCQCAEGEICDLLTHECGPACTPSCAAGSCNVFDGCNGTCGCGVGQTCDLETDKCTTPCTPSCAVGVCGIPNGCGKTCACETFETCNVETHTCGTTCNPTCAAGACGIPDLCGGTCGCTGGDICDLETHTCGPCSPNCDGTCGIPDGCGGTCTCSGGQVCNTATNQCGPCVPTCDDTCLVADGCGGFCSCGVGQVCNSITKQCDVCVPDCAPGVCGINDLCGGVCGCPGGEACNDATSTCVGPPDAPTNLVATAGDGQVELSWGPSSEATSYSIYVGFAPGVTAQTGGAIPGATSPFIVRGLAPDLPAWFVVTASNGAGASPPSNEATAVPTSDDTTPPTFVFVLPTDGAISVDPMAPIRVGFSEPMAPGTLAAGFTLSVDDAPVSGTATFSGLELTFTPDAPLDNATEYEVIVSTALTDLAGNPLAAEQSSSFVTRPAAPGNLTAIAGYDAVTQRWDPVPGAIGYIVYRRLDDSEPFVAIGGGARTDFTDRFAGAPSTYQFAVTALSDDGESDDSNQADATPSFDATPTPTGAIAQPGNGSALIAWTSTGAFSTYTLRRAAGPTAPYVTVATDLESVTYRDTGLTNGTRYRYVVQAHDVGPDSAWSEAVEAAPEATYPPTPGALTVLEGSGWAQLDWTAVPGASGYEIYATTDYPSTAGDGHQTRPAVLLGVHTNTALVELTDGYAYFISVAALDATGVPSVPTAELTANPRDTLAPRPTELLRAYATANGRIHLDWTRSPGATSYTVKRSASASGGPYTEVGPAFGTSYDDDGLVAGPYAYVIEPTSNGGAVSAGQSNERSAVAVDEATEPPEGITAHPGDGCVTFTWGAMPGMYYYYYYRGSQDGGPYEDEASYTTGTFANSYTKCELDNETPYYYVFSSQPLSGALSDLSSQFEVTPSASLPPSVTPQVVAGDGEVKVSWDAPADSAGATYHVLRRSDYSGWQELTQTPLLGYTDSDVTNGTTYYYSLQVGLGGQLGAWSPYEAAATPSATLGAPPTPLETIPGNGCVTLRWAVEPGGYWYYYYRGTQEGGPYPDDASYNTGVFANAHTACGLQNGATYRYVMRGGPLAGVQSGYSAEITVTPDNSVPDSPSPTLVAHGDGQVVIQWSGAAGEGTRYHIIRRSTHAPWREIADTLDLTWFDSTVANGTTYHYVVQSEKDGKFGAWSEFEATATPVAERPAPPSGLSIQPGNSCVTLTWDVGPGVLWTYYHLGSQAGGPFGGDGAYTTGIYANAQTRCGLQNSTPYHYVTQSQWPSPTQAFSGYSTPAVTATPLSTLPISPTPTVTPGNQQVFLAWDSAGAGVTYHLHRRTDRTAWQQIATTTLRYYVDHSVFNDTNYYYAVQSQNAAGLGAWGDGELGGAATPSAGLPAAPVQLSAHAGNTCVSVSWNAVPGATYYYVHRVSVAGIEASADEVAGESNNAHTVCGLPNGVPSTFVVRSYSAGVHSGYSQSISATPLETLPLTPTAAPTATGGGVAGSVQLTWSPIAGAVGYRILRRTDAAPWSVVAQSASPAWVDSGLASGTTYYYTYLAFDAAGAGAQSPAVSHAAP